MTRKLRALVVDDERLARSKLARLLAEDGRYELAGEASDGFEALEKIDALTPDLVILDVQMPGLGGFEVLEAVGERPPFVLIFSTAFDAHALRAFEAHALDYLLKPYAAARFKRALDRAHAQWLGARPDYGGELVHALPRKRDRLLVRLVEGGWLQLPIDSVVSVVAAKKHTRIVCENTAHLVRTPFVSLADRLDARFGRIHRSVFVHLARVERVEPWDHGDVILTMKGGAVRVVTRTFKQAFLAQLAAYSASE